MPTKFATFSPDGEQLAFLGFTDGGWHLCESRLDGSDLEVLAEVADKAISGPAYSPDGSKIAFTAGYPGEEEILIRDLTTGLSSNLSAPGVAWQIVDWTRKRLFGIRSYNRKGHFIRVSVFNPGLISVRGRAIKKRILKVDHSGIFRINLIWAARRTATEIRVRFKPVGALAEEQSKRITRRVPEDLRSSAS